MVRGSLLTMAAILAIALPANADMMTSRPAAEVTPYQTQAIQPYQSHTIQPYQSHTIQPYQSHPIQPYRSRTLPAYRARVSGSRRVAGSQAAGIQPYHAHTIHRLTLSERQAMQRRDMAGYHGGAHHKGTMTEAQIKAYGALNHNLGVWNSGQDFTMQGAN